MKYVAGDKCKYFNDEVEVLAYDIFSGEYQIRESKSTMPRWVDGRIFEKNAHLLQGAWVDDFETFMMGSYDPPPLPEDKLWCKCNNEDKQLVRVVVLKKHHAICRTCKKEDKSQFGKDFLEGKK